MIHKLLCTHNGTNYVESLTIGNIYYIAGDINNAASSSSDASGNGNLVRTPVADSWKFANSGVRFDEIKDIAFDVSGNMYISDRQLNVIRKIDESTGIISEHSSGYTTPTNIEFDEQDNMYVCNRGSTTGSGISAKVEVYYNGTSNNFLNAVLAGQTLVTGERYVVIGGGTTADYDKERYLSTEYSLSLIHI